MMAATTSPAGLTFDAPTHTYTLDGAPLLTVTGVLRTAGLVDLAFYTPDDRARGTAVHAAIEAYHRHPLRARDVDATAAPYVTAYLTFCAESAFRADATEERLVDPLLRVAGTLDLRGEFLDPMKTGPRVDHVDVLDIKSGTVPAWVGYQTAGYVRLLPPLRRRHARRWCLHLRADGTYRLIPLTTRSDEAVFLAACTVAQARAGWL